MPFTAIVIALMVTFIRRKLELQEEVNKLRNDKHVLMSMLRRLLRQQANQQDHGGSTNADLPIYINPALANRIIAHRNLTITRSGQFHGHPYVPRGFNVNDI
jgi:hypothetical protein